MLSDHLTKPINQSQSQRRYVTGACSAAAAVHLVVWPLLLGESALVDAIVDGVVDQFIDLVDGGPEVRRVEVQPGVPGDVVELGVEHPDDLGALVVHHRLELLVPQDLQCMQWNSEISSAVLLCSVLILCFFGGFGFGVGGSRTGTVGLPA